MATVIHCDNCQKPVEAGSQSVDLHGVQDSPATASGATRGAVSVEVYNGKEWVEPDLCLACRIAFTTKVLACYKELVKHFKAFAAGEEAPRDVRPSDIAPKRKKTAKS